MKLRIQDDSIRLRLSHGDLQRLAEAGRVEAETRVAPGSSLVYRVQTADRADLGAELDGTTLTVFVPERWIVGWPDDERVGFEGTQDAGEGRQVALLVEKDFDCLHKRPDETDLFPHPNA
ncbi:DUF7009 family protein [Rubrivirga marina]|uniref:Uncharacterized protein n=1 Tax=Rubrivirga marina TaxID=1196024 RepID=A0A271IWH9_9BACT|nr:hypothetical protein [Rubrivirga marina]PAP75467.1 hypothetical protein BSZ37_02905 [Rubrivirga marina]